MIRREIGSEFWEVPVSKHINMLFPEFTQWFLSGRSALTAIIRDIKKNRGTHTVSMPSWCCDSMIIPFVREGIEVKFYPVYLANDGLKQEIDKSHDVLFLMDYFGYSAPNPDLTGYKGVVIRDITHSIFSAEYSDADYYFGSLRKWCGVKTGGYVWGAELEPGVVDDMFISLRKEAMNEKKMYIEGQKDSKDYLRAYEKAEEYLDEHDGVYASTDEDVKDAEYLDVEKIRKQRRKNAKVLMEAFKHCLIFPSFSSEDCPMFVPIMVPDGKRDTLRRFLIQHEIYCPVHWPISEYHKLGERERELYKAELSLVCDQRYTEEDMYRMVETIKRIMED